MCEISDWDRESCYIILITPTISIQSLMNERVDFSFLFLGFTNSAQSYNVPCIFCT